MATDQKRALLAHIVTSRNLWQVLCFVRTKHGASRLARALEKDGLKTTAIHGDKSQVARLEALDEFKAAKVQVMVATDVAARGLDIDDLPLVVNYEMPHVPEDYIHRIGRTGRAGAAGEAISFCAPEEAKHLVEIERLLKRTLSVARVNHLVAAQRPRDARSARPPRQPRAEAAVRAPRAAPPEAVDRNPDQPPRTRDSQQPQPVAALTKPSAPPSRHWHHKPQPIPALLMKRRTAEPENA